MSPRLTIIALNFAPEPTGTAPYTSYIAKHLSDMGWQVTVVSGTPHYPYWQVFDGYDQGGRWEDHAGVVVLRLRHFVPRNPRLLNRMLMEVHFGIKAAFAEWRHPDVVLLVSPPFFSSAIATIAVKIREPRASVAVWVQDIYSLGLGEAHNSSARMVSTVRRLEAGWMTAADCVVVIHDRFAEYMRNSLRVPHEKLQVIRNWSHLSDTPATTRQDVRQRLGWSENDIVVLHAGNMGVKQGLENVVEAARLSEECESCVRFVLLGGGNQCEELKVRGRHLARLQFIDPLADQAYIEALNGADILLVNERPGVRDMALPSKLTSYFKSGRPIIAAVDRAGTTAQEIKSSGAGVVIPSGEPWTLLEAARHLAADDTGIAERMGANGRQYASKHLTGASAAHKWDVLLKNLLNSMSDK